MFMRTEGAGSRRRDDARGLTLASLPARLRRLCETAIALDGEAGAIRAALGLGREQFARRIAALRRFGLARTGYTFDPRARGLACECSTLVRLADHSAQALGDFEAWCVEDGSVTRAVRICGRFDYQLTSFHRDLREADRWRRVVEARPEVGRVEQRQVRTVLGHQLAGLALTERGEP
jgi:hypothetical protein